MKSTPLESFSIWVAVPKLVGIRAATRTFNVRMIANIAKVSVERVMCEDMSAGENCPVPFAPRILISIVRRPRIRIGRLRATNRIDPIIISMIPKIKISMDKPVIPFTKLPMA